MLSCALNRLDAFPKAARRRARRVRLWRSSTVRRRLPRVGTEAGTTKETLIDKGEVTEGQRSKQRKKMPNRSALLSANSRATTIENFQPSRLARLCQIGGYGSPDRPAPH